MDPYMPDHRLEIVPSPKWVRTYFGGEAIANSKRMLLLREKGHLPVYYFPPEDVNQTFLTKTDHASHCPYKGDATYWTIKVGSQQVENAVWSYLEPLPERAELKGYMAFYWDKMEAWYEEEEQVFVHARDPFTRVDVRPSSRHVEIVLNGQTVADSQSPWLLFETGLPTRYYLPRVDVKMTFLESTDTKTACPYKGQASYYSVRAGDKLFKDIVWTYPDPLPDCPKIKGLLCFYDEKVDAIYVDGVKQEPGETPWSD